MGISGERVAVVGAGITGISCARRLVEAEVPVRVYERSRVPGGRMASPHHEGRPVDIGAAYFTVHDEDFAAVVEEWRRRGLARPWTDTMQVHDSAGWHVTSGPTRWSAPSGLRSLVSDLAAGVDVDYQCAVESVERGPVVDGVSVPAVALAMPDPQAGRLLAGSLRARRQAEECPWLASIAVTLWFAERVWADFKAAFVNEHPVVDLVCDDGDRRGDMAAVLTVHTTAAFADRYLDTPEEAIPDVVAAVDEMLGLSATPERVHAHRWRFARPDRPREASFYLDADNIALAGDGWGTPRVETAWKSGRDLGDAFIRRFTTSRDPIRNDSQ